MIEQLPASWPSVAGAARGERSEASAERLKLACELIAFAALAALVSWRWMLLTSAPPAGRGVAIVAIATAAAALLALLRRGRRPGALTMLAGVAIAIAATLCGLVVCAAPALAHPYASRGRMARKKKPHASSRPEPR